MTGPPADRILIEGLRFFAIIGINDWERIARQLIEIDLTLHADLSSAARTDSIEDTVNYRTISRRVQDVVENSEFGLLEKLADAVARACLKDPRVQKVDVRLRKPGALRFVDSVGVGITRERS